MISSRDGWCLFSKGFQRPASLLFIFSATTQIEPKIGYGHNLFTHAHNLLLSPPPFRVVKRPIITLVYQEIGRSTLSTECLVFSNLLVVSQRQPAPPPLTVLFFSFQQARRSKKQGFGCAAGAVPTRIRYLWLQEQEASSVLFVLLVVMKDSNK